MKVLKNKQIKLLLYSNQQARILIETAKISLVGIDSRKIVNDTLNELYQQSRLDQTTLLTSFSYSIFIVQKTLTDSTRKSRIVIDIRGVNKLLIPNIYSLAFQTMILARLSISKCLHLIDASSCFDQQFIYPNYLYLFTIDNYRGLEALNIPIIGCTSSIIYV